MRLDTLTWEKTSLCKTKEESACQKSRIILDQAHQSHDQAPKENDTREEHARCKAFEHDVCGWFRETVRHEEDSQSGIVVMAAHSQVGFEASKTSVADVCTICELMSAIYVHLGRV